MFQKERRLRGATMKLKIAATRDDALRAEKGQLEKHGGGSSQLKSRVFRAKRGRGYL